MNLTIRGAGLAGTLLALATLTACSMGIERPTAELADASSSIESAEAAGADRYSSIALATARNKLAKAERLADKGSNVEAMRLAHEADLDAQLAAATADAAQAKEAVESIRESTRRLKGELDRAQRVN